MGGVNQARRVFSWDDYRTWDDGERRELIGGESFLMSPAPTSRHQAIVGKLFGHLFEHFRGRPCEPFVSPIDVKLSQADIVQPDVLVVCDPQQIRETHVEGAPSLVIEVLSPSTLRHDRIRKLRLYARAGVTEYWLVQPYPPVVEVLHLDGASYRINGVYSELETLRSPTFPELALDLGEVFTLPVPLDAQIDEVRESAPPYSAGSHQPSAQN